ncbi:protein kinase C-binding protein NELL1-like [Actinia tenebrosa]|uniref:Protein kinase C-binding protein NELL1-like n=1 Tax=Actinia tenebrosa TaxID=6105 RepID=A0A6P8H1Z0_ACTTE|nr:protein kinase C-binding protein NELL1-like [Actinia tenebrosa]
MVSLLVAVIVVLLPTLSVGLTPKGDVRPEDLKYLGCYQDDGWNNRAFRKVLYDARPRIDWTRWRDLSYIVRICASKLLESGKNDAVFSVQNWGECRIDSDPERYKKFTHSSKCISHVAGPMLNAVYKIAIQNCNVNDSMYINGRTQFIPQGPTQCHACKCKEGQTECKTIVCDYSFKCEKYTPLRKNSCCSKCACHHLGKDKMNGEEWDDRRDPSSCSQCRCINGEAFCEKTACSANCPYPEYIPGKCCPRCRPKAPTTSPWEIITLPTSRPQPTFPPWLSGAFGKRSLRKKRSNKAKVFSKEASRDY